jgi:hypothetical protein
MEGPETYFALENSHVHAKYDFFEICRQIGHPPSEGPPALS